MSVTYINPKITAQLAKGLVSFVNQSLQDPELEGLGKSVLDNLKSLGVGSNLVDYASASKAELSSLSKALFTTLADCNVESYRTLYEHHFADVPSNNGLAQTQEMYKSQTDEIAIYAEKWDSLSDKPQLMNSAALSYLTSSFMYVSYHIEQSHIQEPLGALSDLLAQATLALHPEMKEVKLESSADLANSITMVSQYGDQTLGMDSAFRSITGGLYSHGSYDSESGYGREFYPSQVLGALIHNKFEDVSDGLMAIPHNGIVTNETFPGYESYRSFKASIASDVPKPETKDYLTVAKGLQELVQVVKDDSFTEMYRRDHDEEKSNYWALDHQIKALEEASNSFNRNYVRSFEGFPRFERDLVSSVIEHDPSYEV
ncbi:hypothetical protein AB4254_11995 [Vibrio breoganii]